MLPNTSVDGYRMTDSVHWLLRHEVKGDDNIRERQGN